ncbi:MAG: maltose alpha-D-glucosyltransferase [Anaerolineaceae bacterium]|nr:maltose alpha-D-glucosyltransferase [Anaerolineaceae bacterium]
MTQKTTWYKEAVFMELNVRAYKDSDSDGWGDLPGLTSKLDYIKSLGVDAIWMLPIMPSPLRDDGYDVSDFCDIFPAYGSMEDFQNLIAQAHARGLRIIVEIIPNHTSDQHTWFQASRDPNHPEHQKYRDWYVWSDTDQKYQDARIIFTDSETSNWTFDPLRGQYFWHRFYSTQPDLNYDNPEVEQAMLDVVKFWIDQGADGLRVDAPPYLFEREGTNSENLPETHQFLKRMRKFVDEYSPNTLLLSEANQWPEDVIEYFGEGDEMHMNFHFPLMPRLFMALAKGDRTPIEEILARTPALPELCQWGSFLRCHDELTLEMVTPEERQWMWETYSPDPKQRINLGIRRRLAPLVDNDPRKILLLHSMLLTMVGSPFLYYGDEIGMGDNIDLFDRNGLRTPMQWDDSANAGFSSAPADKLYAPVIDDPLYGYAQVNVANQDPDPHSLLNQLRHMIAVRKNYPLFGWGDFTWKLFSFDENKVAAYQRKWQGERVVVLNNLTDQPAKGWIPETAAAFTYLLTGDTVLPGDYTLAPYAFVWLKPIGPDLPNVPTGPNAPQPGCLGSDKQ